MSQNADKYTDPELRKEIKEDVQASGKGGKPGQWSARKAQMMASEYKNAMLERGEEPYKTDKSDQSESQKHLNDWTKEEWQTSEGKGNAKNNDGTEQRYLPKKVWDNMTEEEKQETNEKKEKGSAKGDQHVPNTKAARQARKDAQEDKDIAKDDEESTNTSTETKSAKNKEKKDKATRSGTKHKRSSKEKTSDINDSEDEEEEEANGEQSGDNGRVVKKAKDNEGNKRVTRSQTKGDLESQENTEEDTDSDEDTDSRSTEKGDKEHGRSGNASRLPEKGQKVYWRSTPVWCEGIVVDVLYSEAEVDGIHAKASQDDPRIVLESSKSGKKAVHKPGAVYF